MTEFTKIDATDFFKIGNPATPTVKIQFRTNPKKLGPSEKYESSGWWEEIVDTSGSEDSEGNQNFQNYLFKSLIMEDESGTKMLTLSLSDQNIAELERIIIQTTYQDLMANENKNEQGVEKQVSDPNSNGFLRYFIGDTANVHIRIRIGYDQTKGIISKDVIDTSNRENEEWTKRTDTPEKTVIMSPWYYFMIQDIKTNYVFGTGMTAEIKAFSIGKSFLTKFKLIQQYAVIRGTPAKMLVDLFGSKGSIYTCFNKEINFTFEGKEIGDKCNVPAFGLDMMVYRKNKSQVPEDKQVIEISLGRLPAQNTFGAYALEYKTVEDILNEFCSKAPRQNFENRDSIDLKPTIIDSDPSDSDTSTKTPTSETAGEKQQYYSIPLTWSYDGKKTVNFFYKRWQDSQKKVREYQFYGSGTNLIKNLDIQGQASMWALLNMPLVFKDNRGKVKLSLLKDYNVTKDTTIYNDQRDHTTKPYLAIKDTIGINSDTFDAASMVISNGILTQGKNSGPLEQAVIDNINSNIYKGSIEIVGDPFYMFDETMNPYFYLIFLKVNKPDYFQKDGRLQPSLESPVTGYYTISKIIHKIDSSGFSTTLEIFKAPPM